MLEKFNQLCESIFTDAKRPIRRKRVRVKNVSVKSNTDQYCEAKTRKMREAKTQQKNVK